MATPNILNPTDAQIKKIFNELSTFQESFKLKKPTDEEIKDKIKEIIKENCPEKLNCEIVIKYTKEKCDSSFKTGNNIDSGCQQDQDQLKEMFINEIIKNIKNIKNIEDKKNIQKYYFKKNDTQQEINFVKRFKFCYTKKVPNPTTKKVPNLTENVVPNPTANVDPNTTESEVLNSDLDVDTNTSEEYEDDFEEEGEGEKEEEKGGRRKRRTRKQKKRRTRKQRRNKKSSRKRQ